jgi:CheY-like chemotaxis protein
MPAGFPSGIPGIGDEIDGAMQQAPHAVRHSVVSSFIACANCAALFTIPHRASRTTAARTGHRIEFSLHSTNLVLCSSRGRFLAVTSAGRVRNRAGGSTMGEQQRDRALVVDDDVSIRVMLEKVLKREGFEVEVARDGVEALEKIRSTHFDAVFLDLMMPRVDGVGVLRYLRSNLPETLKSVIIMTAFHNVDLEDVDADSAGGLVSKPFDIHTLVENAREMIANSRERHQSEANGINGS